MAFNIIVMLSTGFTRRPAFLFIGVILIIVSSVFIAWNVAYGLRMFLYVISGACGSVTTLMSGWINEVCAETN